MTTMSGSDTSAQQPAADAGEAFDFVQGLAAELSAGKVELPGFPEVALRVQRALNKEEVDEDIVLRAVSAEPALAMRVLQMANSVTMNPLGKPVVELRSAIARVGYNMVRAVAMAFVMQQLRHAEPLKHLREPLQVLWRRSVLVGSLSMVLARRFTRVNPDSAMLAGIVHGVGKLYILTRASKRPALLADRATYEQIVRDWHAGIARALLENWEMPEELIQAVQEFEDLERDMRGPVALVDVLSVGGLLATFKEHQEPAVAESEYIRRLRDRSERLWQRLRIDREGCDVALHEAAEEIAALRRVLA
jgi:HD-like signal output (HDOD) protein